MDATTPPGTGGRPSGTAGPSDLELHDAVAAELAWTPEVDATGIRVLARHHVVTLSGEIGGFAERLAALRAARSVRGVVEVLDDLRVRPTGEHWETTDAQIAEAVEAALASDPDVPRGRVRARVMSHVVTLEGEVDWNHERVAARHAVEGIPGVHFVENRVALSRHPEGSDTVARVRAALARSGGIDLEAIGVAARDGAVTLTGRVPSWTARAEAERAAWSVREVREVRNRLVIAPALA